MWDSAKTKEAFKECVLDNFPGECSPLLLINFRMRNWENLIPFLSRTFAHRTNHTYTSTNRSITMKGRKVSSFVSFKSCFQSFTFKRSTWRGSSSRSSFSAVSFLSTSTHKSRLHQNSTKSPRRKARNTTRKSKQSAFSKKKPSRILSTLLHLMPQTTKFRISNHSMRPKKNQTKKSSSKRSLTATDLRNGG